MIKLSELKDTHRKPKSSKRIGRGIGSGKGKTCGRGNKGAKSRSGYKRRTGAEGGQLPLYRRIPIRGFSNGRFKENVYAVNLSMLEECFAANEVVNAESLLARRMIPVSQRCKIKVLGNGELTKPLKLEVHKISASAKEKVEKAKGAVTLV
jgi:large subunit ribosomal protein L15